MPAEGPRLSLRLMSIEPGAPRRRSMPGKPALLRLGHDEPDSAGWSSPQNRGQWPHGSHLARWCSPIQRFPEPMSAMR